VSGLDDIRADVLEVMEYYAPTKSIREGRALMLADFEQAIIRSHPDVLQAIGELKSIRADLKHLCTCNAALAEETLEGTGIHPWECECPEPWAQEHINSIDAALAPWEDTPDEG
jgi:hypothetical protein